MSETVLREIGDSQNIAKSGMLRRVGTEWLRFQQPSQRVVGFELLLKVLRVELATFVVFRSNFGLRQEIAQNLPLPLVWLESAVFPRVNQGRCNAHFRRQLIGCEFFCLAHDSNPIAKRLYARHQGFTRLTFLQILIKCDANVPLCNTQQGYSPPRRGRIIRRVFEIFSGRIGRTVSRESGKRARAVPSPRGRGPG